MRDEPRLPRSAAKDWGTPEKAAATQTPLHSWELIYRDPSVKWTRLRCEKGWIYTCSILSAVGAVAVTSTYVPD
jgi:hypothetical protein